MLHSPETLHSQGGPWWAVSCNTQGLFSVLKATVRGISSITDLLLQAQATAFSQILIF